ncbi:hypothetical protein GOP47_0007416 [Adiantum capillus-veneris]|uniref:Glycosyltransferase n=1 Tax=Adiantum capillus-veneris TaxID=13818 RepID=A0A9D4V237_ADICA|nr:hypothetical protein GOP47_0007416 [Adiantum capillus-veneris]
MKLLEDHSLPLLQPPLEMEHDELHVVMVPYPVQSHINPMMQFAKSLIAKPSVKVSFINIKHHHDRIQKALSGTLSSAKSTSTNGKLQFLCVDNGLPEDFDYTDLCSNFRQFHVALNLSMGDPLKELLQNLQQRRPPISCVVFGSFCPQAHTVSAELGLPSFFFWTQSASVLSMYYHAPLLEAKGFFPYCQQAAIDLDQCIVEEHEMSHETDFRLVSYVPGVPPLHPSSFPTLLHIDSISDPAFNLIREQLAILPSCQGVIVNSFEELEKDAYRALQEELPIPVSFVGPLIPPAFLQDGDAKDTSVGASFLHEKFECIEWLDCQKERSVLYVSFGSLFHPSAEDLVSIANGIKESKQPFLWVIRPKSSLLDVAEILPKGFIDDTKQNGLIIPWAPQVQVLSHPSIGAFLTHCGWNSTLESVSMGVPMIPRPFKSDQPTNSTYVCDVWKIGMALKRHDDDTIRSLDVEKMVKIVIQEEDGKEMRRRAIELREAARRAAGSSYIHMQQLIKFASNYNKSAS